MNNISLNIGDKIAVQRPGFQHVGIYVGQRFNGLDVVHNRKNGGVEMTSLTDFAANAPIFIQKRALGNYFEREQIAQRAMSLLGTKYDLFSFNCEHAANFAQSGKSESPQIAGVVFLSVIALLLGGIALLSSKQT